MIVFRKKQKEDGLRSYSQCGEDLIVNFLLDNIIGISKPIYLDIGSHHPVKYNNTYFFYQKNSTGILVEPNNKYCTISKSTRPKDTVVNAGISNRTAEADYFRFDADTLNTFSATDAEQYKKQGHKLVSKELLPLKTIDDVLNMADISSVDFVSMDVEGHETEVIDAWNFDKHRPTVFCIETLEYTRDGSGSKRTAIIDMMREQDYKVYADTYINTIFADSRRWKGSGILD